MIWLSKAHILRLHGRALAKTGGADGLRDEGLLDSALEAPLAGFAGQDAYPTIEARAARLAFGLVNNHPFVDGNKRIGVLAMIVTLAVNGIVVTATNDDLIDLGFGLAEGRLTVEDVVDWVTSHTSGR